MAAAEPPPPPSPPPSPTRPEDLVGLWIYVDGKGEGLVESFHKVFNHVMYDSKHTVAFVDGGTQKVLLRRWKGVKYNSGLPFRVCLSPDEILFRTEVPWWQCKRKWIARSC